MACIFYYMAYVFLEHGKGGKNNGVCEAKKQKSGCGFAVMF